MDFYLKLLGIVAILLLLFYGFHYQDDNAPRRAVAVVTPAPATPVPTPMLDPDLPYTAVAAVPVVAAPVVASSIHCDKVAQAAATARCTVVSCSHSGADTIVTISSDDRNALGNFLDAAMRVGMKNFNDDNQRNYRQTANGARTTYTNTYRLQF